jgi:hypothetical protein
MWAKTVSLRNEKKNTEKLAHPRVRRSFMFSFKTGQMWATTVSLRNEMKNTEKLAHPRVRHSHLRFRSKRGKPIIVSLRNEKNFKKNRRTLIRLLFVNFLLSLLWKAEHFFSHKPSTTKKLFLTQFCASNVFVNVSFFYFEKVSCFFF